MYVNALEKHDALDKLAAFVSSICVVGGILTSLLRTNKITQLLTELKGFF